MATYTIRGYTATSLTVRVSGISSGDKVTVFVRLYDDASDVTATEYFTATGTTLTATVDGLEPETDYIANVRINDGKWIGGQTFTTTSARPTDWEWYSIIESGEVINISADEWNDFCAVINAFRIYGGLAEYDFTAVSRNTPISASIVNEARSAISSIPDCGTLPSRVYAGDSITASFFWDLADALNAAP